APLKPAKLPGLTIEPLTVDSGVTKFDLVLLLQESPQGLMGSIEYNTDLFDRPTIARLFAHFQVLLEGIVAHPDRPVAELPLVSPLEQQQALVDWNRTAVEFPLDTCVQDLFEMHAARRPGALALGCVDRQLTYGELNDRANQLARHLQSQGVGPETVV